MEITWFGHSCFRIRGREVTILADPYDRSLGNLGRVTADIVTISHEHPGHNHRQAVGGAPKFVEGPGEYEIAGVFLTGLRTYHDRARGKERGANTVYLIGLEDVVLCHLGDLGHVLSTAQVGELGSVEVLMVPVGGGSTIGAAEAAETVRLLEPKIVIPMHYRSERTPHLAPLEHFLKEIGVTEAAPQARLTVTRTSLPSETQVVVLEPRV
ncbi:MAG: MBL fold metallo-hydrolase [Chloroflexi bacterium]|nr:MBL fold metallo-hydrolase [Chloroflexota bacterium]